MRKQAAFPLERLPTTILLIFLLLFPSLGYSGTKDPESASLLRISVLDVGQGDSIVIQAPNGKNVLIDGGPAKASPLLLKQLELLGIQEFSLVVATHPHEDHIGGLKAVVESFPIKLFLDNGLAHPTSTYEQLLLALKAKDVLTQVARRGLKYRLDKDLELEILYPPEPIPGIALSELNESSVVTRLTYKDFSMLFQGDAEEMTEARLVKDNVPRTVALKVGHHGSRSSSSFAYLEKIRPQVAIISCETGNDYGHPHPETLSVLRRFKASIYRTDELGQVRLMTDGKRFWVKSFERSDLISATDAKALTGVLSGPFKISGSKEEPLPSDGSAKEVSPKRSDGMEAAPAPSTTAVQKDSSPQPGASEPSGTPPDGSGYAGSSGSDVFHKSSCANVKRISPENLRHYGSREEAISAGKRPAGCCKP